MSQESEKKVIRMKEWGRSCENGMSVHKTEQKSVAELRHVDERKTGYMGGEEGSRRV